MTKSKSKQIINKNLPNDQQVYGEDYIKTYRQKEGEGRIERLIKYIEPNRKDDVLDIGCGLGFLYELLKKQIHSYIGIDENRSFIEANQKRFGRNSNTRTFMHISLKDLLTLNKTAKYDKIFLIDVTEHLIDSELKETINLCHRALKKDGKLFIHTPNGQYLLELLKEKGIFKQTLGHVGVRNSSQYKEMMGKTEFRNGFCEVKYLNHYVAVLKPIHFFSYIPIVGKIFKARLLIICNRVS